MKKFWYIIQIFVIILFSLTWSCVFLGMVVIRMSTFINLFWCALMCTMGGWILISIKYKKAEVGKRIGGFDKTLLYYCKIVLCGTLGTFVYSIYSLITESRSFGTLVIMSAIIFVFTPSVQTIVNSIQEKYNYKNANCEKRKISSVSNSTETNLSENVKEHYCSNCGQKISQDSIFCSHCGSRIDERMIE